MKTGEACSYKKRHIVKVCDVAGFSPRDGRGKYVSRLLIDAEGVGSKSLVVNHFTLLSNSKTDPGSHPALYEEVYYILRGKAVLTLGGTEGLRYELGPDTAAYIPGGMEHQIENIGEEPLEMITIMPFQMKPGVNTIYDERKRKWGTSFKLICPNSASGATVNSSKTKKGDK